MDYGHLRRLSAHERRLQNPNPTHNCRTHAYVPVLGRLVLLACEPKEAFQKDVRVTQTQTRPVCEANIATVVALVHAGARSLDEI